MTGTWLTQASAALARGDVSRSITAENPTGAPGQGGQSTSALGPGRKGSPCITISAGQITTLADVSGAGAITHIWFTVAAHTAAVGFVLRDLVLRMYWDGSASPAVEVPLGDFFCNG